MGRAVREPDFIYLGGLWPGRYIELSTLHQKHAPLTDERGSAITVDSSKEEEEEGSDEASVKKNLRNH